MGTHSVHVGSRKKDQLTKLVIWGITLNALFFSIYVCPTCKFNFSGILTFPILSAPPSKIPKMVYCDCIKNMWSPFCYSQTTG